MSDDLLPSLHALSLSTVDTEMKRVLNWWKEPTEERRQIPRAPPEPIGPMKQVALKLELYPHQAALGTAVQKARDDEDWGNTLLCTFGTGTGKTRGALFAAAQWMVSREDDVDDDGHYARIAVVILPKATMEQWRQEWEKLVTAIRAAVPSKFRDTTETPLPSSWSVLPSSSIHTWKPPASKKVLSLRAKGVVLSPRGYERNSLVFPSAVDIAAAVALAAGADAGAGAAAALASKSSAGS